MLIINSNAQSDSLSYKNGFWKNGEKLRKSAVSELMQTNSVALTKFKNAQTYEVIGYIIGCPSAYVFGYDLGHRLGGGQGNNTMLIAGGIGTAVGVFFTLSSESNYKLSVEIFNGNNSKKQYISSLNLGITSNGGVGLILKL